MMVIETARTRLRELQLSDVSNVLKIFSDARAIATKDLSLCSLRMRNQIKHGSWLLSLKVAAPKSAHQTP